VRRRIPIAAEKKLAGQRLEYRLWKRWRRDRLDALLAGSYGVPAKALLAFFKTMTGPTALIDFVRSVPWSSADESTRFEVLTLVDAVIMKRREKMGLAPFDDALPHQPPNAFLILHAHLFPPDGGATRGAARFDQTLNPPTRELYHEHSNSN
jgi:hypothetical protein